MWLLVYLEVAPAVIPLDIEAMQRGVNSILDEHCAFYASRTALPRQRAHSFISKSFTDYLQHGWPKVEQRLRDSIKRPLPVGMLYELLVPLPLASTLVTADKLRDMYSNIRPHVSRSLLAIQPAEIKLVDKRVLDGILTSLAACNRVLDESDFEYDRKLLQLSLANVLFRSPFLDKRILGLADIKVSTHVPKHRRYNRLSTPASTHRERRVCGGEGGGR